MGDGEEGEGRTLRRSVSLVVSLGRSTVHHSALTGAPRLSLWLSVGLRTLLSSAPSSSSARREERHPPPCSAQAPASRSLSSLTMQPAVLARDLLPQLALVLAAWPWPSRSAGKLAPPPNAVTLSSRSPSSTIHRARSEHRAEATCTLQRRAREKVRFNGGEGKAAERDEPGRGAVESCDELELGGFPSSSSLRFAELQRGRSVRR